MTATSTTGTTHGFRRREDCRLEDLLAVVAEPTDLAAFPHADRVEQGVLVYEAAAIRPLLQVPEGRRRPARRARRRPGRTAPASSSSRGPSRLGVVDRMTAAFEAVIATERASGPTSGDHFAKPGANDRVWNALEGGRRRPRRLRRHYANDLLALGRPAWLGPGYQMTSRSRVNPGGAARPSTATTTWVSSRPSGTGQYPRTSSDLSPVLTLQGARRLRHAPRTGPTPYLPHKPEVRPTATSRTGPPDSRLLRSTTTSSSRWRRATRFFNPALFHAAGHQPH